MKATKTSCVGKGLISPGGDRMGYLGHFRNAPTLKAGHNRGAPGGMHMESGGGVGTPWAQSHQFAAAKQGVRQAKRSGGDVGAAQAALGSARQAKQADVGALKGAQKAVRVAKRTGGDVEAAKAARGAAAGTLKSNFAGAYKNLRAKQTAKKKKNGGGTDFADVISSGIF